MDLDLLKVFSEIDLVEYWWSIGPVSECDMGEDLCQYILTGEGLKTDWQTNR